jgi:hypothetical protein
MAKSLVKRLDFTTKYLTEQSSVLKDKLEQFESLTCNVIKSVSKKRRVISAGLLEKLTHWWRWFLLLKDVKLELYNGMHVVLSPTCPEIVIS